MTEKKLVFGGPLPRLRVRDLMAGLPERRILQGITSALLQRHAGFLRLGEIFNATTHVLRRGRPCQQRLCHAPQQATIQQSGYASYHRHPPLGGPSFRFINRGISASGRYCGGLSEFTSKERTVEPEILDQTHQVLHSYPPNAAHEKLKNRVKKTDIDLSVLYSLFGSEDR